MTSLLSPTQPLFWPILATAALAAYTFGLLAGETCKRLRIDQKWRKVCKRG